MRMLASGILVAVGAEMTIRTLKHQYHNEPISPATFFGALCFLAAISNYINKPIITYLFLYSVICSFNCTAWEI